MNSDSNKDYIDGVFNKIHKKIEKRVKAKYDKIKDWVMDPKGYFLIDIDRKSNLLRVGYCTITQKGQNSINNLVAEIQGTTAIEIVNTLIREKFISTLQHAADMGIELNKAELSLKHGFKYIQDKDLFID